MKYAILLLILIAASCSKEYDLVISNVGVIDLKTGGISVGDVCIKDSLVVEIGNPNTAARNATKTLDGTGKYLMPALWDMHVHIQDSTYLSMFLDYGITGVRDMGGCVDHPTDGCESLCPEFLNSWKEAIKKGEMRGPEVFIAGTQLSGTGWPSSLSVLTPAEVDLAFKKNQEDQVDFIKVYEQIPWEAYRQIARLAKVHGLDFVGHVSEPFLLSDILELGQKSIEHMREPILYSFTEDSLELAEFLDADDYTAADREFVKPWMEDAENVIQAFKKNQAWFTPTMAVQFARLRYRDDPWRNHRLREQLPSSVNAGMEAHMKSMEASADHKGDSLWWMALTRLVKRFNDEPIGLLAGSDAACEGGLPGYSLHEELFLMVEAAGLSPLDALRTATTNPAAYFDLAKNGEVQKNYYADLILLENNPLENIRNTLSINAVIKKGRIQRLHVDAQLRMYGSFL